MSEETKPESVAPATEEKPKAKRVCKKKAAGESTKKTATKKTATKKSTEKKTTTKKTATKTKAAATKKLVKKAAKPTKKASKVVKKAAKKTSPKKKAEAKPKKTAKKSFSKFETFVAEAIKAISTEEKPYVSYTKVKQYLLDYMPGGLVTVIPKMTKKTLTSLAEQKLLKAKKESFAFTKKGEEKLAPAKVEKRKKIDRPVKETKEKAPAVPETPRTVTTLSGRISKQTAF